MNFLSLNHYSLFTLYNLKIKFFYILIHFCYSTLVNKHHIINQTSHFNSFFYLLSLNWLRFIIPYINLKCCNTSIVKTSNQILIIMRNNQTTYCTRMNLNLITIRYLKSNLFINWIILIELFLIISNNRIHH